MTEKVVSPQLPPQAITPVIFSLGPFSMLTYIVKITQRVLDPAFTVQHYVCMSQAFSLHPVIFKTSMTGCRKEHI